METLKKILLAIWNWLKNLFSKPPQEEPDPSETLYRAVSFAINDYPGSQNDLNGCINDQIQAEDTVDYEFPLFSWRTYEDSEVTVSNFKRVLSEEISYLKPKDVLFVHYSGHGTYVYDQNGDEADGYDEALYLYDGPLVDDDINEILQKIPEGAYVLLMFDSCFSGTVTKAITPKQKNRFVQYETKKAKGPVKVRKSLAKSGDRWITFSGCGEHQTSADAYIDGDYHGAFSYFAFKTLERGITANQWKERTKAQLAKYNFTQIPEIEGNEFQLNDLIFYYGIS